MPNYIAHYPKKLPVEIYEAATAYEAQQRAAKVWNLKPSHRSKICVYLCEKDGKQVTHLPLD